jgi:membrane-bound metal-dependent hydrolase YbcI (DUF457 family)
MMGRDHALSGALVGTAVVTVAMVFDHPVAPLDTAILIAVTSGFALWPDIDHPSATAARSFGPISAALASALNLLGGVLFRLTSSSKDKPRRDGHRTITHTLAFALLSGVSAAACAAAWPRWGTFSILFIGLSFALRGLAGDWAKRSGWLTLSATAAALSFLVMVAEPTGVAPALLGVAVTLGSFTHCLGDSCTLAGCPWLWPIRIQGQVWYPIGTPEFLRFRTGTEEVDGEEYLRFAMWVGLVALVPLHVPGAYPWVGERIAALWS